jgi:hypothetical protein
MHTILVQYQATQSDGRQHGWFRISHGWLRGVVSLPKASSLSCRLLAKIDLDACFGKKSMRTLLRLHTCLHILNSGQCSLISGYTE